MNPMHILYSTIMPVAALGALGCQFDTSGLGAERDSGVVTRDDAGGGDIDGGALCGNGLLDGVEQCDGAQLGAQTCVTLGHAGGDLACAANCTLDESACLDVPEDWFDAAWQYRKPIEILGARVFQEENDFPVAIVLAADADLMSHARADGGDILFTAGDGKTELKHDLDTYDGSTGALVAWVQVPTLAADADTPLYMYFGNQTTTPREDPAAVWDAGFSGVYHLEGGAQGFDDASGATNHASPSGFSDNAVAGKLGRGQEMNGSDEFVGIPAAATQGETSFTFCLWINTSENGSDITYWQRPTLFGEETGGYDSDDFALISNNGRLGMWGGLSNNSDDDMLSDQTINDQIWHHVCAVNDGNDVTLWLDGVSLGTIPSGQGLNDQRFTLGARADGGGAAVHHAGVYDELQVSTIARSVSWIQTSYRNQNQPEQFFTLGGLEYHLQ